MGTRFLMVLYLARVFSPSEVGEFGLLLAAVEYAFFLLGLEFHAFASRELLPLPLYAWGQFLRSQATLHGFTYALFLIGIMVFAWLGSTQLENIMLFAALSITEHLAQEGYRLLVNARQPVRANFAYFIRSGLWFYVFAIMANTYPEIQTIRVLCITWLVFSLISLSLPASLLWHMDWKRRHTFQDSRRWLKSGMKVSLIFLATALALQAPAFFDRILLERYVGLTQLGVYFFYMSFANTLIQIVEVGVIIQWLPKIIHAYGNGNYEIARRYMKYMAAGIIGFIVITSPAILGVAYLSAELIDKPIYQDNIFILALLLANSSIKCIYFIPNYVLYLLGENAKMLLSALAYMTSFFIFGFFFSKLHGVIGIISALLISSMILLFIASAMVFVHRLQNV
jgi:O-antigen/teichoic acid export membrane protein